MPLWPGDIPGKHSRVTVRATTIASSVGAAMRLQFVFSVLALCLATASGAHACGGESPTSCDDGERNVARWLLNRAVKAIEHDEAQALTWFSERSHGYRTLDLYVFCIGPDNRVSAHPNATVRGTDATKLADINGNAFGDAIVRDAAAGRISDITYMWPRLEQSKPALKHTIFTRVSDQICGVGYYE